MTSIKKTLLVACAASVLSFGVAMAQTDPNAAAPAGAPPAADAGTAPAADAGATAPAPKKKMAMKKGHKKHMAKKKKAM